MSVQECSYCHRICKDNRGLAIHQKKCSGNPNRQDETNTEFICCFCNTHLYSAHNLRRHQESCKLYLEHIKEEQHKIQVREYEGKIKEKEDQVKQSKEEQILIMNQEIQRLHQLYKIEAKEREQLIDTLNKERGNLEFKIRIDTEKFIKEKRELELELKKCQNQAMLLASDALRVKQIQGTMVFNTNNGIIQTNVLSPLNPLKFQNKMIPNQLFVSPKQIAEHVCKNGLTDSFFVTDSSRHNIIWKDESGNEIKDPKAKGLATRVNQILQPELKQLSIQVQHTIKEILNNDNPDYEKVEQLQQANGLVIKSNSQEPSYILELGKYISNMGHKQGTQLSHSSSSTFSQFVGVLREELSKKFYSWINMSIKDLGIFLFSILNELMWNMSYNTSPTKQFSIKDDFQILHVVTPQLFGTLFYLSIEFITKIEDLEFIPYLIPHLTNYNKEYSNVFLEWIESRCIDDKLNQEIINSICDANYA
jgi:hypothetical protein